MFLEKLTKLFSSAFHRRPRYITVSVDEALAISQPAKALPPSRLPRHVAIIMDGNGRWANARGLPRSAGHAAGTEALREIIRASDEWGIEALSLYAFSTENWARSKEEVGALMALLLKYFNSEIDELDEKNVRITILGDVNGLPDAQRQAVLNAQARTADNTGLKLNIALNYGGRAELVRAARLLAQRVKDGTLEPDDIDDALFNAQLYTADSPDVDLLIRNSGEQRLSNFLPWQTTYAEFIFDSVNWPEFDRTRYMKCLRIYADRDRRFGGVKGQSASTEAPAEANPPAGEEGAGTAEPAEAENEAPVASHVVFSKESAEAPAENIDTSEPTLDEDIDDVDDFTSEAPEEDFDVEDEPWEDDAEDADDPDTELTEHDADAADDFTIESDEVAEAADASDNPTEAPVEAYESFPEASSVEAPEEPAIDDSEEPEVETEEAYAEPPEQRITMPVFLHTSAPEPPRQTAATPRPAIEIIDDDDDPDGIEIVT